jgi:hypothetical protein
LDTPPEEAFDRITRLAANHFDVPVSLITLVDEERLWFKSYFGTDRRETPRGISFCTHAIESGGVMVVENATQDARFADNPLVTGAEHVRFYAGAPLWTPGGYALGTLCLLDAQPRSLDTDKEARLRDFAAMAMSELEQRRRAAVIAKASNQTDEDAARTLIEALPDGLRSGAEKEPEQKRERPEEAAAGEESAVGPEQGERDRSGGASAPSQASPEGTVAPPAPRQWQQQEETEVPPELLHLRDRVTPMLLFDQTVRAGQVAAAYRRYEDESVDTPLTLWRTLARMNDVSREAVYARAAQVYAFESADFNMHSASALIRKSRGRFAWEQWARLVELNVVPIRAEYDEEREGRLWTFASHDPGRSAAMELLNELDVAGHALKYAPEDPLEEVYDDALSQLAGERTKQRFLADVSKGREPREKDVRLVRKRASSSSSVRKMLEKARREKQWGERTAMSSKTEEKGASNAPPEGAPEEAHGALPTPADVFDDVLTEVLQHGARVAYLLADGENQLAVYHRQGRRLRHQRTEMCLPADGVVDFAKGKVFSLPVAGARREGTLERWTTDGLQRFHLSVVPLRELPDVLPASSETEVVVAERLS